MESVSLLVIIWIGVPEYVKVSCMSLKISVHWSLSSPFPIFGIVILVMLLGRACLLTFSGEIRSFSSVGFPENFDFILDCR